MANGLYTNTELIETLIVDLNDAIKQVVSGQYIQACRLIAQISQKLMNLRKTIDDDLKNREQTIETLKNELRNAGVTVEDMDPREFLKGVTDKPVDSNP